MDIKSKQPFEPKYGRPAAKITRYDKEPWYMKKLPKEITSIEELFGTLPNDITDQIRST